MLAQVQNPGSWLGRGGARKIARAFRHGRRRLAFAAAPKYDARMARKSTAPKPAKTIVAKQVPIDRIQDRDRVRKDFSDVAEIAALARNIEELGLLQPIGISPDFKLLWGGRRLRAYQLLGRKTIPARIIDSDSPRAIERAENENRKDFTLSERVNAAIEYEKEIGNRRGRRTDRRVANPPQVRPGEKTRDVAAREAGFTSTTLFRDAKKVVEKGIPALRKWMDQKKLKPSVCAWLASLPRAKQNAAIAAGPVLARQYVAEHKSEMQRFAAGDAVQPSIFPELDAKERTEFQDAPFQSLAKQIQRRFIGLSGIVNAIGDGKLGRDLDWLVKKRGSFTKKQEHDLIHFSDRCRAAARKLNAVAERIFPTD